VYIFPKGASYDVSDLFFSVTIVNEILRSRDFVCLFEKLLNLELLFGPQNWYLFFSLFFFGVFNKNRFCFFHLPDF